MVTAMEKNIPKSRSEIPGWGEVHAQTAIRAACSEKATSESGAGGWEGEGSMDFCCCCAVTQLCPTLQPHGLEHARFTCPSPSPRACSNSCTLSQWRHPTISSSAPPFSSCLQSFPASGSFPVSQLFESGGQSTGASASASVLPVNIQDWFPLGWTGWISLRSEGLSSLL